MIDLASSAERSRSRSLSARGACWSAYACGWGVLLIGEFFGSAQDQPERGFFDRLLAADVDSLVYLLLFALAPLAWIFGRGSRSKEDEERKRPVGRWQSWVSRVADGTRGSTSRAVGSSLLIACASLATSISVGRHFDGLPPAYHDEFSYLFQARTFLAGRLSFPSHEAARLFDQMHVLNEGRFASRYFPGTGLWLSPFVAIGHPVWGHWLAGALCAVLIFWCGRELAGDWAGFLAGLLTALSPGMALFSNLLLAHHPTLVGLSLFLLGCLRGISRTSASWGLAAGVGLCFAALCRPMTAASVALPFGVYVAYWSIVGGARRSSTGQGMRRLRVAGALALPLLAGGALMFVYDRSITGDGFRTPYEVYTDIHTPRHVYGFNNVERGEQRLGPRVIEKYDTWAENLTPRLAARNAEQRLIASWTWTLGVIPLAMALVAGVIWWRWLPTGTRLILAGIVSLHAAHVPYWFVGMQNQHYVFEAGPLWMLWLASVTVVAFQAWHAESRWWLPAWWIGLLVAAVVLNYTVSSGRWSAPLEAALSEVRFGKEKHRRFRDAVELGAHPRPALVLVEEDPADRHVDFVTNDPSLEGDVLIGRYLPELIPVNEVRKLFPDRTLFLYRAKEDRLERLAHGAQN